MLTSVLCLQDTTCTTTCSQANCMQGNIMLALAIDHVLLHSQAPPHAHTQCVWQGVTMLQSDRSKYSHIYLVNTPI